MALVQGAEIVELIVDAGESAKNLDRPGMERLLAPVEERTDRRHRTDARLCLQ